MKSAEELFKSNCDRYTGSGWLMREHHFIKALNEYDSFKNKECADKIVQHLKDYEDAVVKMIDDAIELYDLSNEDRDSNTWWYAKGKVDLATELKDKLEVKE